LERQVAGLIPPVLVSTLRETVSAVAREILGPMAIVGSALTLMGLIMILVAAFLGIREKDRTIPRWEARR
jgi:hypothetical protein